MHQEDPVGDIDNLHIVKLFDSLNNLLPMLLVTRVDGDVTRDHAVTHSDDIHGANKSILEANGDGVRRAVVNHEMYSLGL